MHIGPKVAAISCLQGPRIYFHNMDPLGRATGWLHGVSMALEFRV